ncbi:MAG TPA: TraR/DksA C4-type zinc finger protein [Candidatus Paceibacterota bacterium]|jgi:RNA polymerase-binding transcription factor DksA|nr:TraR/DksA C4-type zinc finger protein [Candidatus Paceibacterota bacterium]
MINANHLKERLEAEQKTLGEELSQIARFNTDTNIWEATPDQDMMGEIDDNDAADRFEDFEERTGMVTTLQARLNDINRALKKIEDGTYGKCEVCNESIEDDRLEANPAARTDKAHMNS